MLNSAIVYTGDCGTVNYPSQLQIVGSQVLCNPAKWKSQIKIMVLNSLKITMCALYGFPVVSRQSLKCTPGYINLDFIYRISVYSLFYLCCCHMTLHQLTDQL